MTDVTAGANADQIAFWSGETGDRWVLRQQRMDDMLGPYGALALARAAARPGEAVLDVGCGCGATALALAGQVGAGGKVFGVDISKPMLARAEERARQLPSPKAEIRFAFLDAQTGALGDPRFDLAFSRFGVMFFADPAAAFANIRGALKPGARVAFACWRALDENPWMALTMRAAFQHLPPPPRPGPDDPGPFSFADPDRVRRILDIAGFRDATLEPHDVPLTLGGTSDLAEATTFIIEAGPLSGPMAEADAATRDAVWQSVHDALAPFHGPQGVRMNGAVWIVGARNP
jgi:SAM-dependent methyltransferase